jgi:hypothetical protein
MVISSFQLFKPKYLEAFLPPRFLSHFTTICQQILLFLLQNIHAIPPLLNTFLLNPDPKLRFPLTWVIAVVYNCFYPCLLQADSNTGIRAIPLKHESEVFLFFVFALIFCSKVKFKGKAQVLIMASQAPP